MGRFLDILFLPVSHSANDALGSDTFPAVCLYCIENYVFKAASEAAQDTTSESGKDVAAARSSGGGGGEIIYASGSGAANNAGTLFSAVIVGSTEGGAVYLGGGAVYYDPSLQASKNCGSGHSLAGVRPILVCVWFILGRTILRCFRYILVCVRLIFGGTIWVCVRSIWNPSSPLLCGSGLFWCASRPY